MGKYDNLPNGVEHISSIVERVMGEIENVCKKNPENSNNLVSLPGHLSKKMTTKIYNYFNLRSE